MCFAFYACNCKMNKFSKCFPFCSKTLFFLQNHSLYNRVLFSTYLSLAVSQLFGFYFYANKLREESKLISYSLYESPWYTYTIILQKQIYFFLLVSGQPLEIMIGNIYPMTLEKFQSIVNASYTYFNLLKKTNSHL